jgi:hypothetical protein
MFIVQATGENCKEVNTKIINNVTIVRMTIVSDPLICGITYDRS